MNTLLNGLVAIAAVSLSGAAFAQSNDAGYCSALNQKYQRYVATAATGHNPTLPSADVENAIAQCQAGNAAAGIPVLERELRNAKIDLPARTVVPTAASASDKKCGPETWSTDQMMYVGVPCQNADTYSK